MTNNKKTQINESRADKLALNYLKSKGVTDYNKQMEIIGTLKHDIPNLRNGKGKFVLGALRCYFDSQLTDYQTINAFDKALGYIFKGNHQDEYDENLNGASVEELANKYKDLMKGDLQADVERSNGRQFQGGSNYRIIPINSFEEARQYAKYTSWCVTKTESAFDQYTNGGAKRFYFCLKNGFENIPKNVGENVPLDEYGLSMISVLIDNIDGGSVDCVTTRWNHGYNGENNPGLSTAEQLEDVLNVPFYQIFKPYTRDELHQMGLISFDEIQELLDSGKDPKEIFDSVDDFHDGFAVVKFRGKRNWINSDNQLINRKRWYDIAGLFNEGFAWVWIYNKGWNWVNTEGQLVSQDQWYDEVEWFQEGFARARLNNKGWNWVNTKGQLINQNRWYDWAGDFYGGFARVKRNDKEYNWVNTKGDLISPNQWYERVDSFYGGFAYVKFDNEEFYVDKNGIVYDFFTHQPLPDDQQPNLQRNNLNNNNLSEARKKLIKVKIDEAMLRKAIRELMKN